MKRRHWRLGSPFFSHPAKHTHSHTHIPGHRQPSLLRSKGSSTLKPRLAGSAFPAQSGPHPDLVPELLGLLSQLLQLTHGAGPVGRGWGRLGAAGRGLGEAAPGRWPEAWEGGDARLTSGPKTAREAAGKGGVEARGPEGVSWAGGAEDVVPGAGMGSLAPKRRCQGTDDFPNLPPGPPETEWEVQEEEQGKPLPRTAARAGHSGGRNWGWGGGGSPFENRPGVRPSPHKAPPSQHLILKRGGASLNSPPHPHTAHPPHTPPDKTEVVMGGG